MKKLAILFPEKEKYGDTKMEGPYDPTDDILAGLRGVMLGIIILILLVVFRII